MLLSGSHPREHQETTHHTKNLLLSKYVQGLSPKPNLGDSLGLLVLCDCLGQSSGPRFGRERPFRTTLWLFLAKFGPNYPKNLLMGT